MSKSAWIASKFVSHQQYLEKYWGAISRNSIIIGIFAGKTIKLVINH